MTTPQRALKRNVKISACIPAELYAYLVDEQAKRRQEGAAKNKLSDIVTEWMFRGIGKRPL